MVVESEARNGKASESASGAADGKVLFHPLSAPRLETAIQCNLRALAAVVQEATSGIEDSIDILAQNAMGLGADELADIRAALGRARGTLAAITAAAGGLASVPEGDAAALVRCIRLLRDVVARNAPAT